MAHLLVVSQYFQPEQVRINELCYEWVRRGHKVTVVTGIPNYPQGKFFPGYGWLRKRRESWQGIDIIRLPLFPRGKNNLRLILNYLSFHLSGSLWATFSRLKPDLIFVFGISPLTKAKIATRLGSRIHKPVILYLQDLWPETLEVVGSVRNKFILNWIKNMMQKIYEKCRLILTTSPSLSEHLHSIGVEKEKLRYLPQFAEDCYSSVPVKQSLTLPVNIVYAGNIGYAQGLEILPETAYELSKRKVPVRFIIIGTGRYAEKLSQRIRDLNVEAYFLMTGKLSDKEVAEYLGRSGFAFLSFMPSSLFEMTIPAKLQSYMAAGVPILAVASGETKRIVETAQCGFCSPMGNIQALADNIEQALAIDNAEYVAMSQRAQTYYREHFDKSVAMQTLDSIFADIKGDVD
ncbi:MAG: glycosyltransferase family 4 protein [Clostridiaceae bacterium]|nr:glycosyltransferase family 4 protein [Clostridiaceae bacterium]